MRCIMAICPAGPPKLSSAILSHTRNATPSVTSSGLAAVPVDPDPATPGSISGCRLVRGPVMRLACGIPAPAIERIVEREASFELGKIVDIHPRQPQRSGQQPCRLRCEIET